MVKMVITLALALSVSIFVSCATTKENSVVKQTPNTVQSHEQVYYVNAKAGNDANAGTRNSPWRTLQRACEIAEAGDTVYVMEGVYTGDVFPKKSGTEAKPIVFEGKDKVVFDGSVPLSGKFEPVSGTRNCHQIPCSESFFGVWYDGEKFLERKKSLSEIVARPYSCWHDNGIGSKVYVATGGETSLKLDHVNLCPPSECLTRVCLCSDDKATPLTEKEFAVDVTNGVITFAIPLIKGIQVEVDYRYPASNLLYLNLGGQVPDASKIKLERYAFWIGMQDRKWTPVDMRFLTFRNMELAYMYFHTSKAADHITLEDMVIHHLSSGVYMRGDNAVLRRVEIYGNRYGGAMFWGKNSVAEQSRFHHNIHFGVSFYADADGGILRNSIVYENIGGPTGEGGIRISHNSRNVSILNNTIYGNSGPGIRIYDAPLSGTKIVNNIIVANDKNVHSPKDAGYALIVNNDCVRQGFQSDYNLVSSPTSKLIRWGNEEFATLDSWQSAQRQDMHSSEAGPLDVAAKEFFLNPPVQAIDKGVAMDGVTTDLVGHKRPCGKGVDIGAIEKQ